MTEIANLPDIRPSLLLDFANSGRVDPRIQCTRASSATCFGPDGKLRVVPANTPRIDYDPETGKCLGLLVEESRTNLVYPSVIPSGKGVVFGKVQLNGNTTAVSGIPSPDGSNNAVSITGASNSTNSSGMDNLRLLAVIPLENVGYSVSFYLKSAVTVTVREASSGTNVSFAPSSKWTRVSAVFTPTSPNQNIIITSAGGAEFSLFGLQVEVGSFPTSYIPTEGSAVTRAADSVSMLYAQSKVKGAMLVSGQFLGAPSSGFSFPLRARGPVAQAYIGGPYVIASNNSMMRGGYTRGVEGGSVSAIPPGAAVTRGGDFRACISWGDDVIRAGFLGAVSPDVAATKAIEDTTHLDLMTNSPAAGVAGAIYISRVALYSRTLTTQNVQRLTA